MGRAALLSRPSIGDQNHQTATVHRRADQLWRAAAQLLPPRLLERHVNDAWGRLVSNVVHMKAKNPSAAANPFGRSDSSAPPWSRASTHGQPEGWSL